MSITVADMIRALRELPPDALLVVTEEGFYSSGELAEIMLPESYTVEDGHPGIPRGSVVYRIGHSQQD